MTTFSEQDSSEMAHPEEDEEHVVGGVLLGHALEQARVRLGYSLPTAATALGISERLLGLIESGLRTPTEGLLTVICEQFGLDRDRLGTRRYVPRIAPYLSDDRGILWLGWLPIHLPAGFDTDYIIGAVGSTLRVMRSLDATKPVYLRASDIPLLIELIDIEDPNLPAYLIRHLGLTMLESINEIQRMQAVQRGDHEDAEYLDQQAPSIEPALQRVRVSA